MEALRPHILIGTAPRQNLISQRLATDTYGKGGTLVAWIELACNPDLRDDPAALQRDCDNTIGAILSELEQDSYQPGKLAIDRVEVDGPWRCPEDAIEDLGDHFLAALTIRWNGGLAQ
jgi:hypothetical protein